MADNTTLNTGSGGDTIATDDITDAGVANGAKAQRIKIGFGANNAYSEVTSTATNPFPVALSDTDNAVLDNIDTDTTTIAGDTTSIDGKITAGEGVKGAAVQRVTISTDDNAVTHLATIAGDTTSIDGKDLMLGTDFSNVLGTASLVLGTQADAVANTADGVQTTNFNMVFNGTTWDRVREGGTAGSFLVDGSGVTQPVSGTVTVTATNLDCQSGGADIATEATLATIDTDTGNIATAVQLIDNPIVAHDAAASGSTGVNMGGGYATNSVEGVTQVANADASHITTDLNGCTVTRNGSTLEELVSERISNTNGTSTACTGAFAAGGANIHAYVTAITIHNDHASTNGYVDIRDGAAGSVLWTFPAPATGGATHNFDPPLKFSANTAVAYHVSAAITTVYISFNGYFAQG